MKLLHLAPFCLLAAPALAQGSDACASAQVIVGTGLFAFDNTAATTDGVPDALCSFFGQTDITADVWFSWTAPSSGIYTITTCALTSMDSKIAVLDGGCGSAVIACNDDACSLQSSLDVPVTSGHQYLIRLGNYPNAATGTGSFSITAPTILSVLDTQVNPANGHTYHLLDGGSWASAESTALTLGAHLATVDDQAEQDWLAATWHNYLGTDIDLWVGLNDSALEGTFVWVDGTPLSYTNWDTNEPSNANGNEDFVALRKNSALARWNDLANAPTGFHANPHGVVELPTTGSPLCFGDGLGTACPCGNASNPGGGVGCLSSLGTGGKLAGSGNPSVSSDSLALVGSQMPNAPCLYFQGTAVISAGAGAVFGDGLRCAGGTVVRLGTKANVAGASQYPVAGDLSVSVRGACSPGDVRIYQIWYRNAAVFCTPSTFNLTNALSVSWGA